jgi:hypothetical protein
MITSLASNYDLKSTTEGVISQGMLRVLRFILAASITIIGLLLGNILPLPLLFYFSFIYFFVFSFFLPQSKAK